MITKYYLLFSEAPIHDAAGQIIHSLPFNYVIKDKFSFFDGCLIYEMHWKHLIQRSQKQKQQESPPAWPQDALSTRGVAALALLSGTGVPPTLGRGGPLEGTSYAYYHEIIIYEARGHVLSGTWILWLISHGQQNSCKNVYYHRISAWLSKGNLQHVIFWVDTERHFSLILAATLAVPFLIWKEKPCK